MAAAEVKDLLEAGAHFGHKTSRWHPKMAPYIHSKRDGIHILDLNKTAECLDIASHFISSTTESAKQVLFVGTKRQAKDIVKEAAEAAKQPYVTERWLGGMLTNWQTIGGRVKHLKDLESRLASGELANRYSKLEVQRFQEEIAELNNIFGGIKDFNGRPGALFIVDVITEINAVKEAVRMSVPIVAIVDTNGDPTKITYPIPANDDAIRTISLISGIIRDAAIKGTANHDKHASSAADADDKDAKK